MNEKTVSGKIQSVPYFASNKKMIFRRGKQQPLIGNKSNGTIPVTLATWTLQPHRHLLHSDCGSKATNLMSFSRLTVLWLKSQSVITTQLTFFLLFFFFFWMLGVGRRYWFKCSSPGLEIQRTLLVKDGIFKKHFTFFTIFFFQCAFMRFRCAWWRWGSMLLLLKLSDKSMVGVSCFLTYHLC